MISDITRYLLNALKIAYKTVHALVSLVSTQLISQSKSIFFSSAHIICACVDALWETLYLAFALLIQKIVRYASIFKNISLRITHALFLAFHHLVNFFLYHPLNAITWLVKTLRSGIHHLYTAALPNIFSKLFTAIRKSLDYVKILFTSSLNRLISCTKFLWASIKQLVDLSALSFYFIYATLTSGTPELLRRMYRTGIKAPLIFLSNATTYIARSGAFFYKKITGLFMSLIVAIARHFSIIVDTCTHTIGLVFNGLRSILEKSIDQVFNIFKVIINCFGETRTRLAALQSVTKTALAGTAGFMFISIPRGFKNSAQPAVTWFLQVTSTLFSRLFVDVPKALWSGFVFLVSTLYNLCIKAITYISSFNLHVFSHVKDGFFWFKNTCISGFRILFNYASTLVIQEYAFIGTVLYVALVILTTFITPFQEETTYPLFGTQKTTEIVQYNRTLPVHVSFELQSLTQPSTTLGDVTVKGILSYNYETGLESARHIDNITIEKVQSYTLKKIGSQMDRRHGITTQFLLTAVLKTTASNAASFPFAPTESSFVLKNNTLSTKEIHYEPAGTCVALKNEMSRLSKINMRPAGKQTNSPKLTITFEHAGLSPLVILVLYALIILSVLAAIASLALLPQAIGVSVSGISTLVLGICWIGCYFFGMLPAINHLMLTLLLCFALSILCFGLNAKHIHNLEAGQPSGRTRWTLCLLGILAAFLTAFIGL